MIPYASFLYFALAGLYVLAPVLVLRVVWPVTPTWLKQGCILVATLVMLGAQYYAPFDEKIPHAIRQIAIIGAYASGQYLLASALLVYRRRTKAKWPGYAAVALALVPLFIAKLSPENAGGSAAGPAGAIGAVGLVEFLGLSYATLRAVDVLIGIHDGLVKSLPPGSVFRLPALFPDDFLRARLTATGVLRRTGPRPSRASGSCRITTPPSTGFSRVSFTSLSWRI